MGDDLDGKEFMWFMYKKFEEHFLGSTHLQKVEDGAVKRAVETVTGIINLPQALGPVAEAARKDIESYGTKFCPTGDCAKPTTELMAVTEVLVKAIYNDYKDLVVRAVNGDEEAIGALAFEAALAFVPLDELSKFKGIKSVDELPLITRNRINGNAASDLIAKRYPGARREVSKSTSDGTRYIDVLTREGTAVESKVGRTSLSKSVKRQINKDIELRNDPTSGVNNVVWEFSKSPITNKTGPTKPLKKYLEDNNIEIIINE